MSNEHSDDQIRHQRPDRIFHWLMAVLTLLLIGTALLPVAGIKFDWVPIHWIAGVALVLVVLFHLYRVFVVHGVREMMPTGDDLQEAARALKNSGTDDLAPAKYDAFQKAYHWGTSFIMLVLLGTGLIMLVKIDTTFWNRDPALLSDQAWGIVYVLHGAGSLVLVFMIILHVYFGVLPEHRALLKAMWNGRGPTLSRKGTK